MRIILAPAAALAAFAAIGPATAATRSYTITSFDRIRVEGPYAVSVTVGGSSFASATGTQRAIDAVSLRVEGRTLYVRADRSAWGGNPDVPAGPVSIRVGTHDLAQAALSGAGSVAIDKLRGLEFVLLASGSGTASIGQADLDRLRVSVLGAATVKVAGRAKQFTGLIRGAGSLDAGGLGANDATLVANGAATIRARATRTAKITASGTASVAIEGGGACTLKVSGSASVTGC